jgi:L-amino acid N-acyltransferase YncA
VSYPRPVMVTVRDATADDLAAITAITNEVIATTDAIWTEEPMSVGQRRLWWSQRVDAGLPVLVAVAGPAAEVVGFASYGPFRSYPGFRDTVEHSVHVDARWRGGGIGPALLEALATRAVAAGVHAMVGAIDAANVASRRVHERLGFVCSTPLPEVGIRHGRRLDLVFAVKVLHRT